MENMNNFCVIFIFLPTYEQCIQISKILVNEELTFTCNVVPHTDSLKGWKNNIIEKKESLIICISKKDYFNKIEERICQIINTNTPTIFSLSIENLSGEFKNLL
jgi:uncharacterized protein involved in tolerance to divalent cations